MAKVALVIGASRGIGRQIAIDLASNGYAGKSQARLSFISDSLVVVSAKSTSDASTCVPFPPDPNSSQSTTSTVAREIIEAGGDALAVAVDVRDPSSVQRLIDQTIEKYSRLDVLVYNSGAIWWASVAETPPKRFRLMQQVNPEGLYTAVHTALPHLARTAGRIVVVSPPIYSRFFRGKTAYAMGKVGMSVLTKGLAMDFAREGNNMTITSLWPAVAIESAATQKFTTANPEEERDLRKATVFSDAVLAILKAPPAVVNGELLLDEDFLRSHAGVTDFAKYSVVKGASPRRIMPAELPVLTVAEQDDEGKRYNSAKDRGKARL
ncbi:short chain dehydrogenase family protein [Plectosphaerella plurivora]|uniref:Short chain dehydrogenase family protein n=1 Tax=Plectosphaerella plurivora TaxID=936078 RepID=A0A9P9A694_9PEZI|nr:short chain dehydrogenase family protein [Plectosphaerella plurivora]